MSIKQKQVLGVTTIVVLVVLAMSAMHLTTLTRTLLVQARERASIIALSIAHNAGHIVATDDYTAVESLRRDPQVRSVLESTLYFDDIVYAAIVGRNGEVIAHSTPSFSGPLRRGEDLVALSQASSWAQIEAIYRTDGFFEVRQELVLGDRPIGDVHVALSTFLVRAALSQPFELALYWILGALVASIPFAFLLAQVVVRPIHVIKSGLSRLGKGDLAVTLDLEGEEFKGLGDIFASLSKQLETAIPNRAKRTQFLEVSRRFSALGRLTAGVAHEVRNPLNAMTIHLELLKQKMAAGAAPDATANHVEVISREIRRLDDVVQGFLKFARPEELSFKAVAPGDLVDEVLQVLSVEADVTGVKFDANVAHDAAAIECDPGIFRQALLNLARNAVQAMPKGGTLGITVANARDGRVEIKVRDTGVGIAPEHLARIFDLYFTTKSSGTGMGLSLVYRTVQLHNGDIDVESTVGVGTTFTIKMPRAGVPHAGEVPKTDTPHIRRASRDETPAFSASVSVGPR